MPVRCPKRLQTKVRVSCSVCLEFQERVDGGALGSEAKLLVGEKVMGFQKWSQTGG